MAGHNAFGADIVVVKGDPLENIQLLENVAFVMKAGKMIKTYLQICFVRLGAKPIPDKTSSTHSPQFKITFPDWPEAIISKPA